MTSEPDTIIVSCNTHGIMPIFDVIDDNGIQDQCLLEYKLPDHMNLIKITATDIGVANISTLENLNEINATLERRAKNLCKKKKPLMQMAKEIRNEIFKINKKNESGIQLSPNMDSEDQKHYKAYYHYADNMFRIEETRGGEIYMDKEFVQFTEGEMAEFGSNTKYINKLIMMEKEAVDFFEMIRDSGFGMTHISQSSFIQWLESMEIVNVIMVDLTCSITTADARTNRKLRRRLRCYQ
jgi:hypothetical protein